MKKYLLLGLTLFAGATLATSTLVSADDTTDVTEKVQTTEGVVSTKDLDETAKDNLVDDQAGILTDKTKESVGSANKELFNGPLKSQFVVVTLKKDPDGTKDGLNRWAQNYFNEKGIGHKDSNTGVLFVLTTDSRHFVFQIGTGLKDKIGQLSKSDTMTPEVLSALKANDWNSAITSLSTNMVSYLNDSTENTDSLDGQQAMVSLKESIRSNLGPFVFIVFPVILILTAIFALAKTTIKRISERVPDKRKNPEAYKKYMEKQKRIEEENRKELEEKARKEAEKKMKIKLADDRYEAAKLIVEKYLKKNIEKYSELNGEHEEKDFSLMKLLVTNNALKDLNLSKDNLELNHYLSRRKLDSAYIDATTDFNKIKEKNISQAYTRLNNYSFSNDFNDDYSLPLNYFLIGTLYSDNYRDDNSSSSSDDDYFGGGSSYSDFGGGFSDGGGGFGGDF